jgi:16S rRNA (guanine966-N2)-methyltransferase
MHIVSGIFRHRKLATNPGATTRPILSRVKVALFDRLQPRLPAAKVLDLFAGTGTIGLEALSRGAASVVFIERDLRAFGLLKQNVAALGVERQTLPWCADVAKCSFQPKGAEAFFPYDIVFLDPPYEQCRRMHERSSLFKALARLGREGVTGANALLVVRCASKTRLVAPACWRLAQVLDYSCMEVHLFHKPQPEDA